MNDSLKNKITEDINKNGYLTELRIGEKFKKCGWDVKYNQAYLDSKTKKSREIDMITSYHGTSKGNEFAFVTINLIIESKKSEKPWVVFCTPKEKYSFEDVSYQLVRRDNFTFQLLNEEFDGYIRRKIPFRGRNYYEAFKNYNEESKIYESIISCSKATHYYKNLKDNNSYYNKNGLDFKFNDKITLEFYLPIIILEGILVKVTLDKKGDALIEEENYIPIVSSHHDEEGAEIKFLPDLFTVSYIETYIKSIEIWINDITNKINKGREKLWKEYVQTGGNRKHNH